MAWITLTPALVQNRLTAAELAAMKTAAIGAGQTGDGILAACIDAVVREVRGHVGGCQRNALGEVGTIPDELEHAALALVRQRMGNRLPGLARLFADDSRKAEYEDAQKLLASVARCQFAIVAPITEAPAQPGAEIVRIIRAPRRTASRETLAGL